MAQVRIGPEMLEFVKLRPQVEAVLQHAGLATWDLLLIDVDGAWVRDEFPSAEGAREVAARLGVRVHDGWDDARIVRRMNARDHWSSPEGQRRAL